MNKQTIARYQPGGDIYAIILSKYGRSKAEQVAAAAATGSAIAVNAVIPTDIFDSTPDTYDHTPRETGFWANLGTQIEKDGIFGAPLESANKQIGANIISFLKSPWVVAAVAVILFASMGGFAWLGKKVFKT